MRLLRRKQVRIHQPDPTPAVEGILTGKPWRCAGHYVIKKAAIVATRDETIRLDDSQEVWVPREKVVMVEVLR
jgi:hypothetical protein